MVRRPCVRRPDVLSGLVSGEIVVEGAVRGQEGNAEDGGLHPPPRSFSL